MSSLTLGAVEPLGVKPRDAERSKNFFALGLVSWMYTRPTAETIKLDRGEVLQQAAGARRQPRRLQGRARLRRDRRAVRPPLRGRPGAAAARHLHEHQRQHRAGVGARRGQPAVRACRCSSARTRSPRRPTSSTSCRSTSASACARSRPRTRSPASARPSAPPTAATSPCTTTSGPGMALKAEAMGLAVSLELPLLIIDIQRGGPSTGLPTKTEAADLLLAMYGRHGESPLPIVAAHSPSDCFFAAIEAARIALKYRTPVILLSDGYLANGTEPWRLPDVDDLPDISTTFATAPNHVTDDGDEVFWPYLRDPDTLARARGPARHARADAPHRRPREGGRLRQRQLRLRQPRAHGPPAGRQGGRHRRRHPAGRGHRRRRRRRAARARLGLHVGRHRRRREPRARARAARSPTPTSGTSTRSRRTSARCCAATRGCSCPR